MRLICLTKTTLTALLAFALVAAAGCTVGEATDSGAAGLTCYPDRTCNPGLTCVEDTCVPAADWPSRTGNATTDPASGDPTSGNDRGDPAEGDPAEGDSATATGCEPGTLRACYTGPSSSENVGLCHAGRKHCDPGGTWGPCEDEVTPEMEAA